MTTATPVAPHERLGAVDALRGVAVLGILAMNIGAFALPMAAYMDPMSASEYGGSLTGWNYAWWLITHQFFDLKMMTIFSMLFGAGLVLIGRRASDPASGRLDGFAGLYYRRLLVLFVIGMLHAYLLWYGDILVAYSLCGLVLYPLRNVRPSRLIVLGVVLMGVTMVFSITSGAFFGYAREQARQAQEIIAAGGTPSDLQSSMRETWTGIEAGIKPSSEEISREVAAISGSALSALRENAMHSFFMQTFIFLTMMCWRITGCMLLGMALMKSRVFSAERTDRFYVRMALAGLGIGMPLVAVGAYDLLRTRFDIPHAYLVGMHFNYVGSVLVSLGYISLIMLAWRRGWLRSVLARLAAVGRIPLTNYLAQSLICTFIFYGWGLGMFGEFERGTLALFVFGVWALQLAWSPWWTARFRFGPAEWLWRTISYGRRQPMRLDPS
ncbi:MAG: DUF418 domain-containing protein [Phycisphaerales bacterium]